MKKNRPAPVPFDFVLEELRLTNLRRKPMFGAHAIYVNDKIVLILRDRPSHPQDNGVWLATSEDHHSSLKKDFPEMRSISVFGPGVTGWQILPADGADFENSVLKACEFIRHDDPRIGKTPKVKLRRSKKSIISKKKLRSKK